MMFLKMLSHLQKQNFLTQCVSKIHLEASKNDGDLCVIKPSTCNGLVFVYHHSWDILKNHKLLTDYSFLRVAVSSFFGGPQNIKIRQ